MVARGHAVVRDVRVVPAEFPDLLTITGLVGIGQGVSWLSPLYALWVFQKVRWHWTLLVFLLAYAYFVYLWFAL